MPRRRRRSLRDILALPRTAAEERRVDRHIQVETAKIRSTWTERTHRLRAGLPERAQGSPPAVAVDELDADASDLERKTS